MDRSEAQRESHQLTGSLLMLVFVKIKLLQPHFSLGQDEKTAFTFGRKNFNTQQKNSCK